MDGTGESGSKRSSVEVAAGPVKIQRSFTRERFVREMEVRRENE